MRFPLLIALASMSCVAPRFVPPARPPADLTLVWVGRGECERFENGTWVRAPQFDYEFSVEQRRSAGEWNSVKSLRRLDAAYDGSAGPRLETWFFHLDLGAQLTVTSSLGDGTGTTDAQFRDASLELRANVSSMAPFDRYRITQHYDYENGALTELVSLDKGHQPWVRNHETAVLFAPHRFELPPTTMIPR